MQGFPARLVALSERCPQAMQSREYWNIKDFVLVKEVGSGAASTVYYALCRKSTQPVAIKMYLKAKLSKLNRRQVEREINIHSSLSHPHIIDFYAAFEDDERIYLVQEYAAGGDLFDDVKRHGGRLPEREVVQTVLYPYLTALAYLHSRGIIHRDIKPENTVFTRDRVMKVTDFGLAIAAATERPVTRLGTLDYMAPEVLRCPDKHSPEDNKERADLEYDASVDVWAMGVLAYELIVGRPPFGMSCREDTMRAIVAAAPAVPEWMSPAAADFIRSALQRAPARRSSVAALLQHPWIAGHMAATARPCYPTHAPRPLPCGMEAAAAAAGNLMMAHSGRAGSSLTAGSIYATAGGAAISGGPHSGGVSQSLLFHPSGPYQRLFPHAGGGYASSSEVVGGGAGAVAAGSGGSSYGSVGGGAVTAAVAYGVEYRPAKRQVQRCQSANVDAIAAISTAAMAAAAAAALSPPPGSVSAVHRAYDSSTSYWVTDGNGFSYDPFVGGSGGGLAAAAAGAHQQQQQYQAAAWSVAASHCRGGGSGSNGVSSPVATFKASDFFASQVARGGHAELSGGAQSLPIQDQFMLALGQAEQDQRQHQQQQHHQQLLLQQQQHALMQQQQQHQQRQQEQALLASFGNGECAAAAAVAAGFGGGSEPPIPSMTAADYYRLHLEDIRCHREDGGGRVHGGGSPSTAPVACGYTGGGGGGYRSPRGLSRSFVVRQGGAGRGGGSPSYGADGAAAAAAAVAATAPVALVGCGADTGGGGRLSPAVSRLLRVGSNSSSGSGSMKRRTPDTTDWGVPPLATSLSLQFPLPQGQGHALAQPISPAAPLGWPSDAPASATAAATAALFPTGGAAHALDGMGPSASPFGLYSGAPATASPLLAGDMGCAGGGDGGGGTSAQAGLMTEHPHQQLQQQLSGSLPLPYIGSHGGRPSRLSRAFRRVDSLDPALEQAIGAATSHSPLARCSGASAAVAAFDQLTLASALSRGGASGATGAAISSTADSADDVGVSVAAAARAYAAAASTAPSECSASSAFTTINAGGPAAAAGPFTVSMGSFGYPSNAMSGAPSGGSGMSASCFGGFGNAGPGGGGGGAAASTTAGGGFRATPQSVAALRLSLPTVLPGPPGPTACSSTGGGGGARLRSHPITSPQVTPWATPLSSPAAAGRLPRTQSQPLQYAPPPTFNQLLEMMEADEPMPEAPGEAETALAAALAGADIGTQDGMDRLMHLLSSSGGDELAEAIQAGNGGGGGGGEQPQPPDLSLFAARALATQDAYGTATSGSEQHGALQTAQGRTSPPATATWMAATQPSPPQPRPTALSHGQLDDRMLSPSWAAAAANAAVNPAAAAATGSRSPVARSGSFCAPASAATHAPSPLGRGTPEQQARAAAAQQHVRTRSLNRFQVEQLHLAATQQSLGAGGGGGAAATAPAAAVSWYGGGGGGVMAGPDVRGGGGAGGWNTAATAAGGGGSGGGGGGGGTVCWNRAAAPPSSAVHATALGSGTPVPGLMGPGGRPLPYAQLARSGCAGGGGLRSGPAVPSPLGLRSSRSDRSRSGTGVSAEAPGAPATAATGDAAATE